MRGNVSHLNRPITHREQHVSHGLAGQRRLNACDHAEHLNAVCGSEFFDPWPQFHLPRPGAAGLAKDVQIVGGDCIRIEHRIRIFRWFGSSGIPDGAIDDEMGNVNAQGSQFTRHALRKAPQGKLAHGERR